MKSRLKDMKHPNIECSSSYEEVLEGSGAGLTVTYWKEFNSFSREELKTMNKALLLEGRRMSYNTDKEKREGITWP